MEEVLVILEGLPAVDDGVPRGAPHGKGVADDGPLRLVVEGHDLAQVVDEAGQLKPLLVRMLVANALSRLQRNDRFRLKGCATRRQNLLNFKGNLTCNCKGGVHIIIISVPEMRARYSAEQCRGLTHQRGH